MTETITRGAANQAGAHLNKNAYAEAKDFLPLNGLDHVEFWVGNARQASNYYRALWGFTPVAYAGLETGVRDRSSYVLKQHDITLVVTAPLTPDGEIAEHDRSDYRGVFAPGYRKVKKPARAAEGMNLLEIDHCVGNVELGEMDKFVDFY